MKSKYFFVINSLGPGGAERSLLELLPDLRARGIDSVVICLDRNAIGLEADFLDAGFDVRWLVSKHYPGQVRELRRMIRSEAPDLVHTVLFEADIAGRLAAVGSGVPVVSTIANTTYHPERISADVNLKGWKVAGVRLIDGFTARHLTTAFHAVSGAVKESAVESLGIDPDKVTVVHRGRDPKRIGERTPERAASARSHIGIGQTSPMILTVGRLEFQKGHIFLIEAFARIADSFTDAVLVIAGRDGNASDSLRDLVDRSALGDKVMFLGHRDDVPDLLVAADMFVFPSLWEGLGGALIEALALEVPIVASDLPALREVVGDGESGLLVPPGDPVALANQVIALMSDPHQKRRIVEGNRARFERDFSLMGNNAKLINLFESVAR